jgi:hypothetical protein
MGFFFVKSSLLRRLFQPTKQSLLKDNAIMKDCFVVPPRNDDNYKAFWKAGTAANI